MCIYSPEIVSIFFPRLTMAGEEKMTPPVVTFQSADACVKELPQSEERMTQVKRTRKKNTLTLTLSIE